MKPFTLDAVLNFRKRLEEQAQSRLLKARETVARIEENLAREQLLLQEVMVHKEQRQSEGIEIGELIRYEERITFLGTSIEAIRKNLDSKRKIVIKEHENLLKCSKEHQIMKRLKEEKNRAWRDYLNKKEAAMLDEIGVTRYGKDIF
jgi:flagellar FliJ protein